MPIFVLSSQLFLAIQLQQAAKIHAILISPKRRGKIVFVQQTARRGYIQLDEDMAGEKKVMLPLC